MLEAGVDVVSFYIEDAHDNHSFPNAPLPNCPKGVVSPGVCADGSFGPGEANYVYQLKAYDKAFAQFFARLQKDGVTPGNTLFVITADENDHFSGSKAAATPAGPARISPAAVSAPTARASCARTTSAPSPPARTAK